MKQLWPNINSKKSQSGNLFAALFGVVVVIGAIGMGSISLMKGPVTNMIKINQKSVTEIRGELAVKLMVKDVISSTPDCDGDQTIEAMIWRDASGAPAPTGGGLIPNTIDTETTDPWGLDLGYCVWDHGSDVKSGECADDTRRLTGAAVTDEPFIAVISAGPDMAFQTTCNDYVDTTPADGTPDNALIDKTSGSDDLIFYYTYAQAEEAMGDNWEFEADADTAADALTTDQNLQFGQDLTFSGVLDLNKISGGVMTLPDKSGTTCDGTTDGQLFRDETTDPVSLAICNNGSGFETISMGSGSGSGSGTDFANGFDPDTANCMANNGGPFVQEDLYSTSMDARAVWGDGTYIYVADYTNGIKAFTFDGSSFTLAGSYSTSMQSEGIWSDGTYIYVADTVNGLKAFSFDGSSFTLLDTDATINPYEVWGDGTYIYTGDGDLYALTFDGTSFTQEGTHTGLSANIDGIWGDGTYIYLANYTSGVRALTFDGSSFSLIDTYSVSSDYRGIWGDSNYIYAVNHGTALEALSFDGSSFTLEGSYTNYEWSYDVWSDGTYIYGSNADHSFALSFDGSNFIEISTFDNGSSGYGIWGDGTYIYLADTTTGLYALSGFACTSTTVADVDEFYNSSLIAYTWGDDSYGQLGDGSGVTADEDEPTQMAYAEGFTQITNGVRHSCGIKGSGEAYCWGDDTYGQLGNDSDFTDMYTPVPVSGKHEFASISAGDRHTCGLSTNGNAWCWGNDSNGRLGNSTTTTADQGDPVLVSTVTDFKYIDVGFQHSCGIDTSGTAYCWGRGTDGELGDGTNTSSQTTPSAISSPTNFVQISAGYNFTCGVTDDGKGWCWGKDDDGELGNGSTTGDQNTPQQVNNITNFTTISAGAYHACGITEDGTAYCWGQDGSGCLGNGSSISGDQEEPYEVSTITDFIKISAGASKTCGISSDNKAYCWGQDNNESLGNGTGTTNQHEPDEITAVTGFIDIDSYSISAVGITLSTANGPDSPPTAPYTITQGASAGNTSGSHGLTINLSSTTANNEAGLGFKIDSTSTSDSDDMSASIEAYRSGTDGVGGLRASVLGSSYNPYLLLDPDGDLALYSQATTPYDVDAALQVEEHSTTWDSDYHDGLLITRNGGSGTNNVTYLGNDVSDSSTTFMSTSDTYIGYSNDTGGTVSNVIKFDDSGASEIYGGVYQKLTGGKFTVTAYTDTATEYAAYNFLRYGGTTSSATTVSDNDIVGSINFGGYDGTSMDADRQASIIGKIDGTVSGGTVPTEIIFRTSNTGATGTSTEHLRLKSDGSVGIGTESPTYSLHVAGRGATDDGVKLGTDSTCSATADEGTLRYDSGSLEYCDGDSWESAGGRSVCIDDAIFTSVSTGNDHTCATLSNGKATCWGRNSQTELGNGSTTTPYTTLTNVLMSHGVKDISAGGGNGYGNTCAITHDGKAYCWGYGNYGRLGNGLSSTNPVPSAALSTSEYTQISVGGSHACAVVSDGTVECWGGNAVGQLGDGSTSTRYTPVTVSGITNAVKVATAETGSCAVLSDGTAKCWGSNETGQLGDGTTTTPRTTPVTVSGLSDVIDISIGGYTYGEYTHGGCALLRNGDVYCWGDNQIGQLGNGTTGSANQSTPTKVTAISDAIAINRGSEWACALIDDGTIYCWGYNSVGQIGDGTTTSRSSPTQVTGITTAVALSTANTYSTHNCAILEDGSMQCWGSDDYGQIGDGTVTAGGEDSATDVDSPMACAGDKYVFVTSETYDGNLGGIDGANLKCQSLAEGAGLIGTYKAWLSNENIYPSMATDGRVARKKGFNQITGDYKLTDDTVVANGWSDLVDNTLDNEIDVDEDGNSISTSYVWTNVDEDGSNKGTDSCGGWLSNSASVDGVYGERSSSTGTWTDSSTQSCDNSARLYCVQQ
jgi:alpha-tubulin suppressor-like RCC1 family protein